MFFINTKIMVVGKNKEASPLDLDRIKLELDENEKLKIDLKDNLLPTQLYKYYLINDNSVNSFESEVIFIAHPDQLNDTMEGNLKLWDFDKLLSMMKNDGINDTELEIKKKFFNEYRNEYFGCRGIICLTKSYQNNLFWPHYTNENGFCLEFNTDILEKSIGKNNLHIESKDFFPISYGELNKIDVLEFCSYKIINNEKDFNSLIPSMYTVAIKDKFWSYEDEWRIIIKSKLLLKDNSFRKLKYDLESISRIFLAEKFFSKDRFVVSDEDQRGIKCFIFNKHHNDYKNLLVFIERLLIKFNDKIFIIGRIEKGNNIVKDIEYKVVIKYFDIHSVQIEFIVV